MTENVTAVNRGLAHQWPVFGDEEIAIVQRVIESGLWGHAGRDGYIGGFEAQFECAFSRVPVSAIWPLRRERNRRSAVGLGGA